jgi:hypothetical protein
VQRLAVYLDIYLGRRPPLHDKLFPQLENSTKTDIYCKVNFSIKNNIQVEVDILRCSRDLCRREVSRCMVSSAANSLNKLTLNRVSPFALLIAKQVHNPGEIYPIRQTDEFE